MSRDQKFVVVGAGLSGTLMACYLGKAGHAVDVYEKRPDPRLGSAGPGRSINLALSARGLHALDEVGVKETVLRSAIPMRGRMIHNLDGAPSFQPYGTRADEVIQSVSREGLNVALLEAAQKHPSVRVFFEKRCVGADLETATAELVDAAGAASKAAGDVLIGSDGAFSAVRAQLARRERYNYRQDFLDHGYKELTIPAGPGGGFALEKNALHIWPRGHFMMIALPNADATFTCTLFWPFEGPDSFEALKTPEQVRDFFKRTFPDAVPLMPRLADEFLRNPIGSLVTVRCSPWRHRDKVVLIGDAAHAVVPFYGQGMNASFEDCSVLAGCLASEPDLGAAFARYEHLRKENTDALADLALHNFIEMRDHTASRAFLLHKLFERVMARLLPGLYIPLYTLISFTRTPYAAAMRRARLQDRLLAAAAAAAAAALLYFAAAGYLRVRAESRRPRLIGRIVHTVFPNQPERIITSALLRGAPTFHELCLTQNESGAIMLRSHGGQRADPVRRPLTEEVPQLVPEWITFL